MDLANGQFARMVAAAASSWPWQRIALPIRRQGISRNDPGVRRRKWNVDRELGELLRFIRRSIPICIGTTLRRPSRFAGYRRARLASGCAAGASAGADLQSRRPGSHFGLDELCESRFPVIT